MPTLVTLEKYTFPLPHINARKTRGPRTGNAERLELLLRTLHEAETR